MTPITFHRRQYTGHSLKGLYSTVASGREEFRKFRLFLVAVSSGDVGQEPQAHMVQEATL